MLAKFISVCHYEIRKLKLARFSENCSDFERVVAPRFHILLNDKRFVFHLYHLIEKIFKIVSVNDISLTPRVTFRERFQ